MHFEVGGFIEEPLYGRIFYFCLRRIIEMVGRVVKDAFVSFEVFACFPIFTYFLFILWVIHLNINNGDTITLYNYFRVLIFLQYKKAYKL